MRRIGILMLIVFFCSVSTARPQAQTKPRIITFDAPGAGTGPNQGTIVYGVTPDGWSTGNCVDAQHNHPGFLRESLRE